MSDELDPDTRDEFDPETDLGDENGDEDRAGAGGSDGIDDADLRDPDGPAEIEGPADRDTRVRGRRVRGSVIGAAMGAGMMGLHDLIYGPVKPDTVIQIEASGDPPDIDADGLDETLSDGRRMVGPPLDEVKARARTKSGRRRR